MPVEPTSKSLPAVPGKPAANKTDPSRRQIPQIPDIPQTSPDPSRHSSGLDTQLLLQIGRVGAVVLIIGIAAFWWAKSKPRASAHLPAPGSNAGEPAPSGTPLPMPLATEQVGTNMAATVDELSKPWDSKKFVYVKPYSKEAVKSMVIKLPSGELWAFSLQEPYGSCGLEYVTDLDKLASQYKYRATHPMVGNPCSGAVYDPLKVGPIGGDTWARGVIVQGAGLRPPFSIDVMVNGRSIVADRME
jgi:hypothetical protein